MSKKLHVIVVLSLAALVFSLALITPKGVGAGHPPYMYLTITDYEVGLSYAQVYGALFQAQSITSSFGKAPPVGIEIVPCYADDFGRTINYGSGPIQPPQEDIQTTHFGGATVAVPGNYRFGDEGHVYQSVGQFAVDTVIKLHCWSDSHGDDTYTVTNQVTVWARIPVNKAIFVDDQGNEVTSVAAGSTVNLKLTLDAPAPPSNTFVMLHADSDVFDNLPPYFAIPATHDVFTLPNLHVKKPSPTKSVTITASTVGQPRNTNKLSIH
jgi:hypothetical protein